MLNLRRHLIIATLVLAVGGLVGASVQASSVDFASQTQLLAMNGKSKVYKKHHSKKASRQSGRISKNRTFKYKGNSLANGSLSNDLEEALKQLVERASTGNGRLGVLVTSVKTNRVLVEKNADTLINPASNVKLVTSAAALHILKPEYRFKTEYYISGRLKDGVLQGDLVVKGYGDPTISSERLERVATELHMRGIEKVTGAIVVDDSYFDDDIEANGWEEEAGNDKIYTAPTGSLSLNQNTIGVFVRPNSNGENAFVAADPPAQYIEVNNNVRTSAAKRPTVYLSSRPSSNTTVLSVGGSLKEGGAPAYYRRRIYHPTLYFASSFFYFLQKEGIKAAYQIKRTTVPFGAKLLFVDRSPPLHQIIGDLNKYSNNFIGEMLVKAIGAKMSQPGSFDSGLVAISRFLEEKVGVAKGAYKLGNGSGLSQVNMFTPRHLVKLLTYMYNDFETSSEYIASLSVAGAEGTIRRRLKGSPAERRMRAKTGTLHNVTALSGYVVTKSNDVLAFSVLAQGDAVTRNKAKLLENYLGEVLALGRFSDDEENVLQSETATNAKESEWADENMLSNTDESADAKEIPGG